MKDLESWRLVWRDGFVPQLTKQQLEALRDALASDDPRLIQGATTTPPPLMCVADWAVECGCVLSYCGVVANGGFESLTIKDYWDKVKNNPTPCKVGTAEEEFAKLCFNADQRLGEPAACRWFLNWFDDTPRNEMREKLLGEVELNLKERESKDVTVSPRDPGSVA